MPSAYHVSSLRKSLQNCFIVWAALFAHRRNKIRISDMNSWLPVLKLHSQFMCHGILRSWPRSAFLRTWSVDTRHDAAVVHIFNTYMNMFLFTKDYNKKMVFFDIDIFCYICLYVNKKLATVQYHQPTLYTT